MKTTVYLSRKLLNQLKVKETESKDLMLTHNLHNIIINGKRVGCSGHIQNVLNNKCVYVSTEKSCYQPLSDKNMVRYAASMKDYSSVSLGAKGRNQFVTNDELVGKIIDIDNSFVLLDDYSVNLHEWKANRGSCIKLRNGINGNGGTWKGESVTRFDTAENIADRIWSIIKKQMQ